jgi:pectate lyase
MTFFLPQMLRLAGLTTAALFLAGCPADDSSVPDDGPSSPPTETSNTAPVISGTPQTTSKIGDAYSFVPTAADADGDSLAFSIEGKPDWADFDTDTGKLSATLVGGIEGNYPGIVISVTDGEATASLAAFTIVVQPAASEPPPEGPPPTAMYTGFGSATKGALSCPTGMTIYEITTLSGGGGNGTLRDAVSEDCRHIVFEVSGDIPIGDLQISNSYLTIDGSTAPSPGITLTDVGRLALEARSDLPVHDIIVNNIRAIGGGGSVEGNDLWELDGSGGAPVFHVVLDHLTMIGSSDGNVDIHGDVHDVTLSNSLVLDSLQGQQFSQAAGTRERLTIYGNVYARVNERQPHIRHSTRSVDFVGNVIYGWGWHEGGASGMVIDVGNGQPSVNVERNVYLHVSGLNGSGNNALVIRDLDGSWFFDNNGWPRGEFVGDHAGNSIRIGTVHNGVDYAAPRQLPDIRNAGTRFQRVSERELLRTIHDSIENGGEQQPPEEPPPGEPPPEEPPSEEPPPEEPPSEEPPVEEPPVEEPPVEEPPVEEPPAEEPPVEEPPPASDVSCEGLSRGIPDPCSHFGFDIFADYGIDETIEGDHTQDFTITAIGTPADPYVVDARNATFRRAGLTGQYAILLGGTVNAGSGGGPHFGAQCNYCVFIDVEVAGPGTDAGHSSAVSLSSNTAWVRGSIHGFGDNRPAAGEQDFHGMKIKSSDVWVIDAEIYDLSGDSIQCGDASRGSCSRVYISGGYMHDNRENAVDIKNSRDVVVSGVRMEGFRPTNSSSGVALVLHDDARDARILDNIVRDSTIGIVSSGFSGHIIDGNDVQALGVGIQLRNTQNITVTGNKVNAPTRIEVQGGISGTVQQ